MKLHLLTAIAVVLSPLLSNSSKASATQALEYFVSELNNDVDLVERNYFVDFKTGKFAGSVDSHRSCSKKSEFQIVSSKKVLNDLKHDLSEAVERAYDGTDSYFDVLEKLNLALKDLSVEIGTSELSVCYIDSTPAYSDGHSITIVRRDGLNYFFYEVGHPD